MEVYKFVKPLFTNMGNHLVGERIFNQDGTAEGTNNYYPENGGYPIWDRNIPVMDYVEFVEEVDKPLEYFTQRIYTQCQVDEILKQHNVD